MSSLKRIPITQLQPGQYVTSISQQLGKMRVAESGWVRSQHTINTLIAKGIVSVTIDEDQNLYEETDEISFDDQFTTIAFETELVEAKKVLNKLNQFIAHSFKLIREKDIIDISELHYITMEFIASSYRNPSTLLGLTRITYYTDFQVGHAIRCAAYFCAILRNLKWPADVAQNWIMGALVHDIGKLTMPQSIQNPNNKNISNQQRAKNEFIKPAHVENGIDIADFIGGLPQEAIEIISMHHERLDGSGYPSGQKVSHLNDAVRIFCIINEFDRLTRVGVQGKPLGVLQAFRQLLQQDKQFDSEILQRFIKCIGVYPAGTLVKLKSGKVGLILDHENSSIRPNIKIIYNSKERHHLKAKIINLMEQEQEQIEGLFYGNKEGIFAENYL